MSEENSNRDHKAYINAITDQAMASMRAEEFETAANHLNGAASAMTLHLVKQGSLSIDIAICIVMARLQTYLVQQTFGPLLERLVQDSAGTE